MTDKDKMIEEMAKTLLVFITEYPFNTSWSSDTQVTDVIERVRDITNARWREELSEELAEHLFNAGIRPKEGFEVDIERGSGYAFGAEVKPKQYEEE